MAITTINTQAANQSLFRLLQLSSAALPVGGYSFSQGLEFAIEEQWLRDATQVQGWLSQQLTESLTRVDLPLLLRQLRAAKSTDSEAMKYWNAYALACRETAELRLTDTAMGGALIKLLVDLDVPCAPFDNNASGAIETTFVSAFALAAAHWQLDGRSTCSGYLWSWAENQVAAATKLVPLGQTSAQRLLGQLIEQMPEAIAAAEVVTDEAIGASLPALAMASAWHETQYTRLFRS